MDSKYLWEACQHRRRNPNLVRDKALRKEIAAILGITPPRNTKTVRAFHSRLNNHCILFYQDIERHSQTEAIAPTKKRIDDLRKRLASAGDLIERLPPRLVYPFLSDRKDPPEDFALYCQLHAILTGDALGTMLDRISTNLPESAGGARKVDFHPPPVARLTQRAWAWYVDCHAGALPTTSAKRGSFKDLVACLIELVTHLKRDDLHRGLRRYIESIVPDLNKRHRLQNALWQAERHFIKRDPVKIEAIEKQLSELGPPPYPF